MSEFSVFKTDTTGLKYKRGFLLKDPRAAKASAEAGFKKALEEESEFSVFRTEEAEPVTTKRPPRYPPPGAGIYPPPPPELPEMVKRKVSEIGKAGISDIKEMKGLPKMLYSLGEEFLPFGEKMLIPGQREKLLQFFKTAGKEELKAYGELIRHPIRSFEKHPVYSGMRLLPPLGVAGALGRLGVGAKIAKGMTKIPKIGPKLESALLRPHALELKLQTLFRQHRGKVGLGRLGAREAAESLHKGFSSAERVRLQDIMTGSIVSRPGQMFSPLDIKAIQKTVKRKTGKELTAEEIRSFAKQRPDVSPAYEITEPIKHTRDVLAEELRKRGLLAEETYLTKLPKKRVKALNDEKLKLQKKVARLEKHSLYPGKAKQIKKLQGKIEDIDAKLYQHYHRGGGADFPLEYMPREYLKHIENKQQILADISPKKYRISTPWQKGRDISLSMESRRAMGEILDNPAYLMYNAISRESRAIATYDLFQDLAKNPKWVWDGRGKMPEGWIRVSETENLKSLGDLSGKWVRPDIAESINRMSKVMGKGAAFYTKALSLWKWGKVVPRMGTHMRNIYNNLIFADFAGLSPFDPRTYNWLRRALKEYRSRGPYYQELVKEGMLGTEFYGVEILPQFAKYLKSGKKANLFDDITDMCKGGLNKLGEIYQAEDQITKLAIHMVHRIGKKAKLKDAIYQVDRYMPNYAEVPGVTRVLRQTAVPFFSFKSEAIRIAKNAAQDHPVKLAFWMMMPGMITDMSAKQMGLTDKQVAKLEASRPEYARNGMYALTPSDKEDPRWVDLTYVMFLGDLTETTDPRTFMANPVFTTGYAIATKVAGLQARELFSGRKITRPGNTFTEEVTAWLDYSAKQFGPSAPLPGSYDYDKLRRAFLKKPHPRTGKLPSKTWTALDVFGGIRTKTFGPPEEQQMWDTIGKQTKDKGIISEIYRWQQQLNKTRKHLSKEEIRKIENKLKQLNRERLKIWAKPAE